MCRVDTGKRRRGINCPSEAFFEKSLVTPEGHTVNIVISRSNVAT